LKARIEALESKLSAKPAETKFADTATLAGGSAPDLGHS
jgi:hypothetical protein